MRKIGYKDCITSRAGNRKADSEGIDLINTGGFAIQCKCYKDYVPVRTIDEIKSTKFPILVTQGDRKEAMAVMRWIDLLTLIETNGNDEAKTEEGTGEVEDVVLSSETYVDN